MKKSSVKAKGGQNKTNSLGDLISLLRRLKVFRPFFTTSTKNTLTGRRSNYIKSQTAFRVLGTVAISSLVLLFATVIAPIYNTTNSAEATTNVEVPNTLTFTSANSTASVNLTVDSTDGTFATSTDGTNGTMDQRAKFSISTNNYTGYTLKIKSTDGTTTLSQGSNAIATLPASTTYATFSGTSDSSKALNNKWGYIPNYYNSAANTANYYPAPTTDASTLRVTDSRNSVDGIENADEYTIGLGLRADFTNPSGTYTNETFVLEYVANLVDCFIINYEANNSATGTNLYFGNDSTKKENTVYYDATSVSYPYTEKYSHTPNVDDNGTKNSDYANSYTMNDVVTISGAARLGITLTWGGESASYDWVSFWAGNYPSYTAASNYSSGIKCGGNTTGKYGGGNYTAAANTIQCEVSGDTVTFAFKSDGSVVGDGYGYYAKIIGYDANGIPVQTTGGTDKTMTVYTKTEISGSYSQPTLPAGVNFVGWATSNTATSAEYANAADIAANMEKTNLDSAVTLYPVVTTNVTIKTATGISQLVLKDGSTQVCSATSTSGTTCALTVGKAYTVTATVATGYAFGTLSKSGVGTLSSTANNATFTVGLGAATITSSASLNSYNITVNWTGSVSSVEFTNATYGTQTVSASGGVASLKYNQQYNITVTLTNGNHFVSWAKTSGSGTLGSTSTMNTTFRPGAGTAVLTLTSANTRIKTNTGIDSVTIKNGSTTVCTTTDATTGAYCNLTLGSAYTLTATPSKGYSFSSWSHTGSGTIAANSATTTFTPAQSSSIDVITPSATGNSYTLTVVFGNTHVTSVTVGGQTFTQSGGTKTLTAGTAYTISGVTDLSTVSFRADSNGEVSGNTLKIYGNSTLTATGVDRPYMQGFTLANCSTTPTEVVDERDGTSYLVAKLADGNCWMLDNLTLDLTDSSVKSKLSSANTNASDTTLGYLKNGGGSSPYTAYAVAAATSTSYYNRPAIAKSGICYDAYCVNGGTALSPWSYTDSTSVTINGTTSRVQGKIGIYYNYCAASAGSYCYSGSSSSGNATEDICPAGWHLPTGNTAKGSFSYLYNTGYRANYDNFVDALSTPLSGYLFDSRAREQGDRGLWWSSTRYDNYMMCELTVASNNVYPTSNFYREYGLSVRCVATGS